MIQKVLIIGSGGAGKFTLARQLGAILSLEVVHLDALYWHPGWVETPKPKWREVVQDLLQQETWIMDGNYGSTLDIRLAIADTVIFLDFPRLLCLWRVFKRWWQYANETRPDMAAGCPEKLDWEFLYWVWTYPSRHRSTILEKLSQLAPEQRVLILRSPSAVQQFLQELQ